MANMQIQLQDGMKERLAIRAAECGYASVEEFVQALLRTEAGEGQVKEEDFEELLLKRLESGPGIPFNSKFADQLKNQIVLDRRATERRPAQN